MSGAVSARYPVGCRTCGAAVGEACRTKTTGRVTDTHQDRIFMTHERSHKLRLMAQLEANASHPAPTGEGETDERSAR